jgi:hypothetical protein
MKLVRVISIAMVLVSVLGGCAESEESSVIEFGGVSGTMRTSNTSHYSLELTNTGETAVTALKGRVEVLDDFGEVSASIPVELTSRTRREAFTDDGEVEVVPFGITPGETVHYIVIEFTDYSSDPIRFVRDEEGFQRAIEDETVVPLDPENAADSRFVVEDVVC